MALKYSRGAEELLLQAKKLSIGRLDPVVKVELIFLAFLKSQHPLWQYFQKRFYLSDNGALNAVYDALINQALDSPEVKKNIKEQKIYFSLAEKIAKNDAVPEVDDFCLWKAIFLMEQNCILEYLHQQKIDTGELLSALDSIAHWPRERIRAMVKQHGEQAEEIVSETGTSVSQVESVNERSPEIENWGRNLCALARKGQLDPVYYRDEEISAAIEILCRRRQNNPILIGFAGVGKTAVVEGIAQRIVSGQVPKIMLDKTLVEINLTSLLAGTIYRGQYEERLQAIIQKCEADPNLIIFIDEVHMLAGAGGERGTGDAANILKPALAKGSLRCLGATTPTEYKKYIASDRALNRRFQTVWVKEPSPEQTFEIVKKAKAKYETFHGVSFTEDILHATINLADKFITQKNFPGKAIDLLDQACAREALDPQGEKHVRLETVAAIIAKEIQVPITRLLATQSREMAMLEERLKQRVIGQDEAIRLLVQRIQLTKMGMDINPRRPEGVFLFVGSTGVGKTELSKSLAWALLGDEGRLFRFEMSEYENAISVNALFGSSLEEPGEEGLLTYAIRNNPCSIFLLDEIEHAHPSILERLKKIFSEGSYQISPEESIAFSRATMIMTTNVGAEVIAKEKVGTHSNIESDSQLRDQFAAAVNKTFDESFLQAIDDIIYFNFLSEANLREIIRGKLDLVRKRLETKSIKLVIEDPVIDYFQTLSDRIRYGAKLVNKQIEDHLLQPVTTYIVGHPERDLRASITKDGSLKISS
jgi:ATP-dependent Clp protease ATP-binding subunit ClpC